MRLANGVMSLTVFNPVITCQVTAGFRASKDIIRAEGVRSGRKGDGYDLSTQILENF